MITPGNHSFLVIPLLAIILTACGGSSTDTATIDPEPVRIDDSYVAGEYKPSDTYRDYCNAPRSGIDSFTNETFPDKEGSQMTEKLFLRSFTDETYLWYDEVPDLNPAPYTVLDYFQALKTDATTESGKAKDEFHFTRDTAEYRQATQSGASFGFGFNWHIISSVGPNRRWYISYVDNQSPAQTNGVVRGDKLISVDGESFANGEPDILNAGLFPSEVGEEHTFGFQRQDGTDYTITVASLEVTTTVVDGVTTFTNEANRKVGYYRFNTFIAPGQDALIDAFETLAEADVSELIVDLRYNGGGLLAMSSQMAYMVAGRDRTTGEVFEQSQYNDKTADGEPMPFFSSPIDWDQGRLDSGTLPSVELERIYVLTSDGTCSASEAFINGLRGIDVEVRQIGDTTCGKPYGFLPEDNCGTTYFTVQFKGANAKGFGDYSDGFSPSLDPSLSTELAGCFVEDDVTLPLGTTDDPMISAALNHMVSGTCPAVASKRRVADFEQFIMPDPVEQAYKHRQIRDRIDTPIDY